MDLVVDANILFASLIKDGATIEVLFEPEIHLFAPEYLFFEISKHKDELAAKTKRGPEELESMFSLLRQKISVVPIEEISPFLEQGKKISPDPNDAVYFALALRMGMPIWSNDKKLKTQKSVKVYSTSELIEGKF